MNLSIFQDPRLKELENSVDQIIQSLPSTEGTKNTNADTVSSDMVKAFITRSDVEALGSSDTQESSKFFGGGFGNNEEVKSILNNFQIDQNRISKYTAIEEVYNNVPMIAKMLKVWCANILQKNPVTGKSYLIRENKGTAQNLRNTTEYLKKKYLSSSFVNTVMDYFDLFNKLKFKIIPMMQYYGDCFCELVDIGQVESNTKDSENLFMAESIFMDGATPSKPKRRPNLDRPLKTEADRKALLEDIANIIFEETDVTTEAIVASFGKENPQFRNVVLSETHKDYVKHFKNLDTEEAFTDYVLNEVSGSMQPVLRHIKRNQDTKEKELYENFLNANFDSNDFPEYLDLTGLTILIHNPKNILILQTKYGSKLGYVEICENTTPAFGGTSVAKELSTAMGKLNKSSLSGTASYDDNIAEIVKLLIRKLLDQVEREFKIKRSDITRENLEAILSPEIFNTLRKLVLETRNGSSAYLRKFKTRFISVETMFQFKNPSTDNDPYGMSFIEPLLLQGKLYMLNQLGNLIAKMSRAAPIRKWTVDVGTTQIQTKHIQSLKRELYNQRVTLDSLLSFKSIPKILSEYKDMMVISKGGQKSVDLEIQSLGDSSIKTQDLEDARRELISLSGIPSSYLGYSDTVELQSQLVKLCQF